MAENPAESFVLQEINFESVSVNLKGEILSRLKGSARCFPEALGGGASLMMVQVPAGIFQMGSRVGSGFPDEHPLHTVRVRSFFLGEFAVTQAQWLALMGKALRYRTSGEVHPADRVSWLAAQEFCRRLSNLSGRDYRLPSEAEWEYACRAGTTSPFCYGETLTTGLANYVGEYVFQAEPAGVYRHGTTPGGSFPPNAFGLYDMHGNVWEWCQDTWHEDYAGAPLDGSAWEGAEETGHILRGGCWHDPPDLCRSAARLKSQPGEGEDFFGFRVALSTLERSPRNPGGSLADRLRRWLGN